MAMETQPDRLSAPLVIGRASEIGLLSRVLDEPGPRVCFIYGVAGIGKSSLLARFRGTCTARGVHVVAVDCRSIEPTEQGFLDALRRADPLWDRHDDGRLKVLLVDTYEVFRIADPWLRTELLPMLGADARVVVAGREPPMLEWAVERGRYGGLQVVPLGPLDEHSVDELLLKAHVPDAEATSIKRLCCGHPLALRLAIEARLAGGELPDEDTSPRVIQALADVFRDGLNDRSRETLDAAAVPRRITRGVLAAMLGEDRCDDALDELSRLAVVDAAPDGLRLHDAVHLVMAERLRAVDPQRFRQYRSAAWRHLQSETRAVARHELARSTADVLFLIDNPVVREAFFPTTAHAHSVEQSKPSDADALRALWHNHDCAESANVLDHWLDRLPNSVRVVRERTGAIVGCSIVASWRDIPQSLERVDPVLAGFASHAARNPLQSGQTTVVLRRWLTTAAGGDGPSSAQAAAWLDVKRDYFNMRPHLGRVYTTLHDPAPFIDALIVLGFTTFGPAMIGPDAYHLGALDFGCDSVDGWLTRLAAAELGITEEPFLDPNDRTVAFGDRRVQLSPLEYGVMALLARRRGTTVSRTELLGEVWGEAYDGASNVVDVVVRGLRVKAGSEAHRISTTRGIGYRLT
jgi:Transcriptional regulatory protein, C terminal/AAA ATPase domain